ncbi:glycerate kinase [Halobacillus karajensis]|uniref:glycerate kinase n=1 Tax=Halobacillus karajensis TaxID=195088 RepID=UPI0008A7A360|nr:glycerate kinase [Halobacillus karajensis]SEH43333.1 glycerate kinase [Halobacillus karajensis]
MKIIIAPDSFKGSMSAVEAANSIHNGIKKAFANAETVLLPVGDGGEGTMETLVAATGGHEREVKVTGPLGNDILATFGILGDRKTCVIEMATASGLKLVPEGTSPLNTTTYGTGQLIKQALDDGFTNFILAIGGSSTNDGGAGMLQALGMQLLDREGKEVRFGGGALDEIYEIDRSDFDKRISSCSFLIASDVQNPLIGINGASYVFGPQKGAGKEEVEVLDSNMAHWADKVEQVTGVRLHDRPGAGAAGGIGGSFQAFFPSKMDRGIDVVLEYINIVKHLDGADLVITGEGRVDRQTISGKTPMGVAQFAKQKEVPTIIIGGAVGEGIGTLYDFGVVSVTSMMTRPMTIKEAMDEAEELLTSSTEQVVRAYFYQNLESKRRMIL